MPDVGRVGKRGAVIIPADMRRRHSLDEGALFLVEEREEGVLFRPATAVPIDEYRRQFFAELQQAVAAARRDEAAWTAEVEERRILEGTLMDGLDPDEIWTDDDVVRHSQADSRALKDAASDE